MTTIKTGSDIDRGKAWVAMIAIYCGIVILSTSVFMSGVLYVALLEKYPGDEAKTSLVGALNQGLLCTLGPLVSIFVAATSTRVSMVTGGIILTTSCFASFFVTSIDGLIVTYGIFGGIGNGITSMPYVVVLGYYFEKYRYTVISLSTAVIGIGMFIASPLALLSLELYGLQGTFLIIGALNAHICIVGVVCEPSSIEIRLKKQNYKHENGGTNESDKLNKRITVRKKVVNFVSKFSKEFNFSSESVLSFVLFLFSTLTWNCMISVLLLHLPNYVALKGASNSQISTIMMCLSVSNTIGRFLAAMTVNSNRRIFDSLNLHVLILAMAGLVTLTFPAYSHIPWTEYVIATLVGVLTGCPNSLMTTITLRIVGVEFLSAAHGLEYLFSGIGTIIGPTIVGALFAITHSYESSFYFSGGVVLAGSGFAALASLKLPKTSANSKGALETDVESCTLKEVEMKLMSADKFEAPLT